MKILILNGKKIFGLFLIIIFSVIVTGIHTVISVSQNQSKVPIYCVERKDNKIAVTFNCAWSNEDIDEILNILDKNDVCATFFIVGTWAEKYPEDVKKIADNGHEIASHSYNHSHYKNMSYDEILSDIEKADNAIKNITGMKSSYIRGGYGEYNNDVLNACDVSGHIYIQWSLDSLDYNAKSPDEIYERITSRIKAGDIILMHTGTEFTAKALEDIIPKLSEKYELSTVSDIIYHNNYTIDFSGKQIKHPKSM